MHKEANRRMKEALEHFREDLKNLRTGKANVGMLDGVSVEVYGSEMRMRDVAQVTSPESRVLVVTPFDRGNVGVIGKSIEKANLGVQPIVEGNLVRLVIPPMDESLRKEMVKVLKRKLEEVKVRFRTIRRELNDSSRRDQKSGDLTEDELKKIEKRIQEETDTFCKKADEVALSKEEEIMTV